MVARINGSLSERPSSLAMVPPRSNHCVKSAYLAHYRIRVHDRMLHLFFRVRRPLILALGLWRSIVQIYSTCGHLYLTRVADPISTRSTCFYDIPSAGSSFAEARDLDSIRPSSTFGRPLFATCIIRLLRAMNFVPAPSPKLQAPIRVSLPSLRPHPTVLRFTVWYVCS